MFANLKNKLLEEVKASPQKFQQLANAAQAAVSSSASSTASESVSGSDQFFSITEEEDTPQNSPKRNLQNKSELTAAASSALSNSTARNPSPLSLPAPIINSNNGPAPTRVRRLSNSSVASDVSFRLPSYDSPAVYHLQSDLDISASEMEDSASGPSASTAHLDRISKEQLHSAYKKSLERYHKYRARYTDLAKRYRDLEHDSTKARAVLVETQDKAIRRISELREQCSLEQQAKAHLEEALRLEMDDMQCRIKAYKTKLELLGENPENITQHTASSIGQDANNLINLDTENNADDAAVTGANNNTENGTCNHQDELQVLNEKIQKLEDLVAKFKQKVSEQNTNLGAKSQEIDGLRQKVIVSDKIIEDLKKREEENVILLAQNKQMIHSELDNKESEVKRLKGKIIEIEKQLQQSEKEKTKLKAQSTELSDLQAKFKQLKSQKQEFEAKLISNEHILSEVTNQLKSKEKQFQTLEKNTDEREKVVAAEYEEKLIKLKEENDVLNEMIKRSNQSEVDLAQIDNELNRTKTENDALRERVADLENRDTETTSKLDGYVKAIARSTSTIEGLQLQIKAIEEEKTALENQCSQLVNEISDLKSKTETQIIEITDLKSELKSIQQLNESTESEAIISLQTTLTEQKAKHDATLKSLNEELNAKDREIQCQIKALKSLETEIKNSEQLFNERIAGFENLAETVKNLQEQLRLSELKIDEIRSSKTESEIQMEKEKLELKSQVTNILQEIDRMEGEMKIVRQSHAELEAEKSTLEKKIEKMQKMNQENREGSQKSDEKVKKLEVKIQKIESENAKLTEVNRKLEEDSVRQRMQLKDNEINSKRDKEVSETMVKESEIKITNLLAKNETAEETIRKLNEKMSQVLDENSRLHNAKEIMEHEHRSLQDQCESKEKEKLCVLDSNKCLQEDNQKLKVENIRLSDFQKNEALQRSVEIKELQRKIQSLANEKSVLEGELKSAKEQLDSLQTSQCAVEEKEVLLKFQEEQNKILTTEIKQFKDEINSKDEKLATLQEQYSSFEQTTASLKEENATLLTELSTLKGENFQKITELESLLKRSNDEKTLLMDGSRNTADLQKKLINFEELKIENEYLNKLANQLEFESKKHAEDKNQFEVELIDLKDKFKSQQCELYVLSEKKDEHIKEMSEKLNEIAKTNEIIENLEKTLAIEREELQRQNEHTIFITQQNDMVQKELLLCQTKFAEAERNLNEARNTCAETITENQDLTEQLRVLEKKIHDESTKLNTELASKDEALNDLAKQLTQVTKLLDKLEPLEKGNDELKNRIHELEVELSEKSTKVSKVESNFESSKAVQFEMENLRTINSKLQSELEELKHKSSGQISNLHQEIDDLSLTLKQFQQKCTDYDHLNQKYNELTAVIETLRSSNHNSDSESSVNQPYHQDYESLRKECDDLNMKLKRIMHEVQDVSNRNLFLEQKCENYLIIEQSNERLKLANEKLARQLDETLVSVHHNEAISPNTEFEYLRNIMFQYLTGNVNSNSETLVKVIAAVLKFSPQQTQVAIEKEHQRHTLVGSINSLL